MSLIKHFKDLLTILINILRSSDEHLVVAYILVTEVDRRLKVSIPQQSSVSLYNRYLTNQDGNGNKNVVER